MWSSVTGGKGTTTYYLDSNRDGQWDAKKEDATFDLRLEHGKRAGTIWLRTFPVDSALSDRELRVLMQQLVDAVAGAGYEGVQLSRERKMVEEKRYAAEIVERFDATLAGAPAYVATIDVANIDQIKLTPTSRQVRVQLVLRHTDFRKQLEISSTIAVRFPVMTLAGYSNLPEDFATDLPAFLELLARIEIAGQHGYDVLGAPPTTPAFSAKPAAAGRAPGEKSATFQIRKTRAAERE